PERARTTSCASSVSVVSDHNDIDNVAATPLDPFKQIDATSINAQYSASIMQCASGTDSDADSVTLGPDGTSRGPGTIGGAIDGPAEGPEDVDCEQTPLCQHQQPVQIGRSFCPGTQPVAETEGLCLIPQEARGRSHIGQETAQKES
ncbi:hypothetical protein evm_014561, partial [Chilo suppressalis]